MEEIASLFWKITSCKTWLNRLFKSFIFSDSQGLEESKKNQLQGLGGTLVGKVFHRARRSCY